MILLVGCEILLDFFFYWFYWKKQMVHDGILMETIGISVMVSIGLLLFFF